MKFISAYIERMAKARRNPNIPSDDVYETWRDNFSNKEKQKVYEKTQAWIDNLRESTINYSLSSASTKSNLTVERTWLEYEKDMHTLVGFLSVVDKLLEEIKDTKKWISKRWLSKAWKKTMKEAKAKLNQCEKQLKAKKKALLKQNKVGRAEIYDNDIDNLRNSWQQLNRIREEIWMAQRGEYASIASYLYNSPEIARKSNKRQADNLEFNQDFQQKLKEWAISTIFNWNLQDTNAFLRRIAQREYTAADYQIYAANSAILNPYFQKYQIAIPTDPRWTVWWIERTSRAIRRSVDYSNMDWWDTFKQWGLAGLIDKVLTNCSNMTPWQKDTWKTLWVLGIIGWVIYGQYKFYTSKNIWWGTKIWLTILPIFWSQFLTWKDPITLFSELLTGWLSMDELKNKFGNAVWWLSSSWSESAEIAVPALQSEMVFNSWVTVGSVQQMTQTFIKDKSNRHWKTFFNQSCDKIQREYWNAATESFRATFSEDFDEEKWKNWLASFWITWSTDKKETVHELADNAYNNKVIFEKFLSNNKLQPTTNPSKKAELEAYIRSKNEKNESIEFDDLNAHLNERFIPIPQSTNQDATEKQDNKNIEIKSETIKPDVEKWLSKVFNLFKSKYWRIAKIVGLKESAIKDFSPWITNDIITKICQINWNTITLDLSDNKIQQVYDNFIKKFANSKIWFIKNKILKYNWNGLKSKFKQRDLDWKESKHDERKGNLTTIFQYLFWEIIPTLEWKWLNIKYSCNWQSYSNFSEAIKALEILRN